VENVITLLKGILLNLSVDFGNIPNVTILILLIFEHGRSSHHLMFSSIAFFSVCNFPYTFLSHCCLGLFLDIF
jgi:hypothetical protein